MLLLVEEAVLDVESTVCVAVASFEEMGTIRCGWEGISSTANKML